MNNVDYLLMAERRADSLHRYNPDSAETRRLDVVCFDLIEKLTSTEHAEYEARKNFTETTEQKAKRLKAEYEAMEKNRDSNSI